MVPLQVSYYLTSVSVLPHNRCPRIGSKSWSFGLRTEVYVASQLLRPLDWQSLSNNFHVERRRRKGGKVMATPEL